MGSSSAAFKALATCALESHLSSGMNHQLKIAKMVTAAKITPAYHGMDQRSAFITVQESTHEVERFGSNGEEERRNLDCKDYGVEKRRRDVKVLGKGAQLEL